MSKESEYKLDFDTVRTLKKALTTGDDIASSLEQYADTGEHESLIDRWDSYIEKLLFDFNKAGINLEH
jgi:hypothetical protein